MHNHTRKETATLQYMYWYVIVSWNRLHQSLFNFLFPNANTNQPPTSQWANILFFWRPGAILRNSAKIILPSPIIIRQYQNIFKLKNGDKYQFIHWMTARFRVFLLANMQQTKEKDHFFFTTMCIRGKYNFWIIEHWNKNW